MELLTDREREVARMAARSNKQIGEALGISANTEKVHMTAAYKKLGLDDNQFPRARLVAMAERGKI